MLLGRIFRAGQYDPFPPRSQRCIASGPRTMYSRFVSGSNPRKNSRLEEQSQKHITLC